MTTLAIVNGAAGGGRCGRRAAEVLSGLEDVEVAETARPGHATELARAAAAAGRRRFLAVGGDGTAFEVLNGLFPATERPVLGFLPLGTGNSFLRHFDDGGLDHALRCIRSGATRPCDVVRIVTREGEIYSINLVSLGFPADVAAVTNRRFKGLGTLGYVLGVLTCLVRLPRRVQPLVADGVADREPSLMHTFANSRYTGGRMLIAPDAVTDSGRIEHVRVGPIGRWTLLRALPRLFDGTYVRLPFAQRQAVREVAFEFDGPVDLMIDGEVVRAHPERLEVLPGALDVMA